MDMTAPSIIREQTKPAATTTASLYTVPTGRRARVSIFAVNDSGIADTARAWLRVSGAPQDDNLNLLVPDISVGSKNETALVGGAIQILLNESDIIDVESAGGDLIFQLNGYEDDIPV